MAEKTDFIDVNSQLDGGDNRTDVDEIITKMMKDGKINEGDKAELESLQQFFDSEKGAQLDDTRAAMGEMFKEMLEKGYTVTGANIDGLEFILKEAGFGNIQIKTLFDTEADLKEGKNFSLTEDKGVIYINAAQKGDEEDIIRFGYFDKNSGAYVQEKADWYSATDDMSDNNTLKKTAILEALSKDISEAQVALIDTLNKTNLDLEGKNTNLTTQVDALNKSSNDLINHTELLKSDMLKIGGLLTTSKKEANKLTTDVTAANKKITQLTTDVTAANKKITNLENIITGYKQTEGELRAKVQELALKLTPSSTDTSDHTSTLKTLQGILDAYTSQTQGLEGQLQQLEGDYKTYQSTVQDVFTRISEEQINAMEMSENTDIETLYTFFTQLKQIGANQTELQIDPSNVFTEASTKNKTLLKNAIRTEVAALGKKYNGVDLKFSSPTQATAELKKVERLIEIIAMTKDEIGFPDSVLQSIKGKIQEYIEGNTEDIKIALRVEIAELNSKYSTNESFSDIEDARSLQSKVAELRTQAQTVGFPETVLNNLDARAQEYIDTTSPASPTTTPSTSTSSATTHPLHTPQVNSTTTPPANSTTTPSTSTSSATTHPLHTPPANSTTTPSANPTTDFELNNSEIQPHNSLSQTSVEAYLGGAEAPTKEMIVTTLQSYVDTFPVWKSAEQKTFWQSDAGYQAAFALQAALAHLGMNPGTIDGVWGPKSSSALSQLGQGENPGPKTIAKVLEKLEK